MSDKLLQADRGQEYHTLPSLQPRHFYRFVDDFVYTFARRMKPWGKNEAMHHREKMTPAQRIGEVAAVALCDLFRRNTAQNGGMQD